MNTPHTLLHDDFPHRLHQYQTPFKSCSHAYVHHINRGSVLAGHLLVPPSAQSLMVCAAHGRVSLCRTRGWVVGWAWCSMGGVLCVCGGGRYDGAQVHHVWRGVDSSLRSWCRRWRPRGGCRAPCCAGCARQHAHCAGACARCGGPKGPQHRQPVSGG